MEKLVKNWKYKLLLKLTVYIVLHKMQLYNCQKKISKTSNFYLYVTLAWHAKAT